MDIRVALLVLAGCGRFGFAMPSHDGARDGNGGGDGDGMSLGPDAPLNECTRIAIADNFDGASRSAFWTLLQNNPVTVSQTSGQLAVTLATSGGAHYGGYDSSSTLDFRGHCMFISYIQVPTNEAMVDMNFGLRTAIGTTGFDYHEGTLDPYANSGTFTSFGGLVYDPSVHKILLMREDNGTTTWATSADGVSFTHVTTQPTPFDLSAATVVLEAGTFGSAPAPGTAIYDDFNSP